jgi:hypothetical protein
MVRRDVVLFLFIVLPALGSVAMARAETARSETVFLVPGGDGTSIAGKLQGGSVNSFVLTAEAGQRLIVSFAASNPKACLDLVAPDGGTTLFEGESGASNIDMVLPVSGEFVLRVELAQRAAARDERADYRLTIRVPDGD